MTKCLICGERPSRNGNGFCHPCQQRVDKETKARKPEKPSKFLTYRGHVVGMFPAGKGMLKPRLLSRSPKGLPKSRTLDLNTYLEGFDRDTIKRLKATVLNLAHA
jgi:hypothetical protein